MRPRGRGRLGAAGVLPGALLGVLLAACEAAVPSVELMEDRSRAALPPDSASGEIPFTGTAAMLVPVHINGEGPLQFALDTGSTLTCVDHRVAERLQLPERPERRGVTAGAAGIGHIRVVMLDSLRVGGVGMHEVSACVVELGHARRVGVEIDGLLGLNFLRAYHVGIDFDRGILSLRRHSDP